MISVLDRLRLMVESETKPSSTFLLLKRELGSHPKFKGFTDAKWMTFANEVKGIQANVSAFSGCLVAFLKWVYSGGKLPATTGSLEAQGLKTERYPTDRTAGILGGDGLLDVTEMTGRDLLKSKVQMTEADRASAERDPSVKVRVWNFGEEAIELGQALRGLGVK